MMLRSLIEQQIFKLTGYGKFNIDYENPAGDPGFFGPDSVCWQIHSDFACMLCGGISALMLQMLHPLALAGVWDHSTFREDLAGRLQRTSQFIAITTYGATADAEEAVNRVKDIHLKVAGTALDGRSYSATDGELLTWVHTCEVFSFMQAYLKFRNPDVSVITQNKYYSEVARTAVALGAVNVPETVESVAEYLKNKRSELIYDERTAEVLRLLLEAPKNKLMTLPIGMAFTYSAFGLLPEYAKNMYPLEVSGLSKSLSEHSVRRVVPVFRWALRNGGASKACKRMGVPPIYQWPEIM